MKFILTFDGELRSSGNSSKKAADKWAIRKAFHPQLAELFQTSRALGYARRAAIIPTDGAYWPLALHHSDTTATGPLVRGDLPGERDLFEPIARGGKKFFPLVRESLALACGLKITFLRKEEPGSLISQGGDLDNRIKTLFDALRMPTESEVREDDQIDDPLYCLMESDSLITGFSVETDRLLSKPGSSAHEVRLIIEVDVRVLLAMHYNTTFLRG